MVGLRRAQMRQRKKPGRASMPKLNASPGGHTLRPMSVTVTAESLGNPAEWVLTVTVVPRRGAPRTVEIYGPSCSLAALRALAAGRSATFAVKYLEGAELTPGRVTSYTHEVVGFHPGRGASCIVMRSALAPALARALDTMAETWEHDP